MLEWAVLDPLNFIRKIAITVKGTSCPDVISQNIS